MKIHADLFHQATPDIRAPRALRVPDRIRNDEGGWLSLRDGTLKIQGTIERRRLLYE